MKRKIKKIIDIGLAHVFGAYTLNKVIAFLTSFLLVRILSKTEYGYFSSAFNTYSFFNIFTGLGMLSAELLYCTEERNYNEKRGIYRYTLLSGLVVDLILGIIICGYGVWGPVSIKETRVFISMFSLLLCFEYFSQYILCVFRTKKDNHNFSFLSMIISASYLLFGCGGAFIAGVYGAIIGRYIACSVVIVIGILRLGANKSDIFNNISIRVNLKKEIWDYSLKSGLSGFLNHVIYLIDVAMLSYIIADPDIIASYKFATLIPESMSFIPQAVIVTVLPYFISNMSNREWIKNNTKKLVLLMGVFNAFVTLSLICLAPFIIHVFGGEKYSDSVIYFRILSISYFFLATFRLFSTNLLAVFRKVSFNIIAAAITGIINIFLDYFMIVHFKAIGAAIATVLAVVIGSCISLPYLIHVINHERLGIDKTDNRRLL